MRALVTNDDGIASLGLRAPRSAPPTLSGNPKTARAPASGVAAATTTA